MFPSQPWGAGTGAVGGRLSAKPPAAPSGAEPLADRCTGVKLQKDQPERSARGAGRGGSQVLFSGTWWVGFHPGRPSFVGRTPKGLRGTRSLPRSLPSLSLSFFFFQAFGVVSKGGATVASIYRALARKRRRKKKKKKTREIRSSGWCVFPVHLVKRGGKERQSQPRPTRRVSDLRSELTLKFLPRICLSPTMGNRPTRVENSSRDALSSPRAHSGRDSHPRSSLQIKQAFQRTRRHLQRDEAPLVPGASCSVHSPFLLGTSKSSSVPFF